jgi:DNA-binding CsgD family transcriptional regulator
MAQEFRIKAFQLASSDRRRHTMNARKTICFALRCMGHSYKEIGNIMDLHHATVMAHVQNFKEWFFHFPQEDFDACVRIISKYVLNED